MKGKCTAILLAAGKGSRMKSDVRKQFLMLKGKPVLYYSLRCFQDSPLIDEIILVASPDSAEYCRESIVDAFAFTKVSAIIPGGKERYDSVYAGLKACRDTDYVFIHDGARPFVTEDILERGYQEVVRSGACIAGVPSKDTVKIADEEGCVQDTPLRSRVWIVQTPQIFSYDLIMGAYEACLSKGAEGITDDAMIVEKETDTRIHFIMGSYRNIKLTTPEDLLLAETLVSEP